MSVSKKSIKRRTTLKTRKAINARRRGGEYNLTKEGRRLRDILNGETYSASISVEKARATLLNSNGKVKKEYLTKKLMYNKVTERLAEW